jgi:hypothetical protein
VKQQIEDVSARKIQQAWKIYNEMKKQLKSLEIESDNEVHREDFMRELYDDEDDQEEDMEEKISFIEYHPDQT